MTEAEITFNIDELETLLFWYNIMFDNSIITQTDYEIMIKVIKCLERLKEGGNDKGNTETTE